MLKNGTMIVRDFDLWIRCSTKLGHRGDQVAPCFHRWFQGSALNCQPGRYDGGKCPYGDWDVYTKQEPHLLAKDALESQIPEMEELIDKHMAPYVESGEACEIGVMMRQLVWDMMTVTSYGRGPDDTTKETLRQFDAHSYEFDHAMRMGTGEISEYKWPKELEDQIKAIGNWCWETTTQRVYDLQLGLSMDKTDVLTTCLKQLKLYGATQNETMLRKMEGALRGCFTGGVNNGHTALCGLLITNAQTNDSVYEYLKEDVDERIENVFREALRMWNSIPVSRQVRPEDDLVVDGVKIPAYTKVILSTFAMNTDPRNWENPDTYDPTRFEEKRDEIGFMCGRGFVPLGAAAELGGRPCGARFHDAHMTRQLCKRMLMKYKFKIVRPFGYMDFKQNSGTGMYCGNCVMKVTAR